MKKYLIITLLSLISFMGASAQFGSAFKFSTVAGDSLVNTDTVFKKFTVTAGYSSIGIQAKIKKGTGTLTGKIYLYASMGDNDYQLIDSSGNAVAQNTFVGVTNTAYTYITTYSKLPAWPYTNYLIAVTQSGTLTSSPVQVLYTTKPYFH